MAEFLLYAQDDSLLEPDLPIEVLAARMKLFDCVVVQPDGWGWGEQELKSPRFRLVFWPALAVEDCDQLLTPQIPTYDPDTNLALTYLQPRGWYLNLRDPRIASALPGAPEWWADTTRSDPSITIPDDFPLTIQDVLTARPPVLVG